MDSDGLPYPKALGFLPALLKLIQWQPPSTSNLVATLAARSSGRMAWEKTPSRREIREWAWGIVLRGAHAKIRSLRGSRKNRSRLKMRIDLGFTISDL